ncbi:MAG: protein kinase [Deltaproteobacteria bacterium]|nr:protein kinase [Deltaproteobacteria bacterium]
MSFLLAIPLPVVIAVAALLVLVLAFVLRGRSSKGPLPGIEKLLAKGRYDEAASLALRNDRLEEALEYYIRAQKPARAAQVAARLGQSLRAAELYERGGDYSRAAHFYEQAGQRERAEEARRKVAPPLRSSAEGAVSRPTASDRPDAADPAGRARQAEADFRAIAPSCTGSDVERARLQDLAREAAEALLAAGEVRRAADVYRDGGLDDEAIHLYVNVLGSPGEAAPLLAASGNHERAAELYEMAGQKERAAAAWVDVARASKEPERYVDRIEQLSDDVALRFLENVASERPASEGTAEIHYRLGKALARRGDTARALETFAAIRREVGDYKDVGVLMAKLEASPDAMFDRTKSSPPVASIVPPTAVVQINLGADDLSSLALEAARSAAGQVRKPDVLAALAKGQAIATRMGESSVVQIRVVGLEQAPVSLDLLFDTAVRGARAGPSIGSLRKFIGDRPCDLQNIEVFFRLGLAQLAAGQWREAVSSFEAVEEASPGYRDADRRAEEIRKWQSAVGSRMTALGRGVGVEAGDRTGRYELRGELGRGGMAVVYRAVDQVLGRDVALKFMSEEYGSHAGMRDMFQREARSIAQLNHPNIVTIHDFGELEGRLFICMEYVDGKSVASMTEEDGKLGVVEALRVTKQVLSALEYAHGRNIIHRDVKPSNMMRTTSGLVKLMDFGLAKQLDAAAKSSVVAGTPEYMSPEQLRGEGIDHRADLFSVGASLYEMLTGKLPFDGMVRQGTPTSLRSHVPSLPPVLDEVMSRAVALDPGERFPTAAAFLAPIGKILDEVDRVTAVGRAYGAAEAATVMARPRPRGRG